MMEKGKEPTAPNEEAKVGEIEENEEPLEIVLFQVSECYVYLIPPRKTAGSYRADEWNVNKWAWEGILKVINKGEECIIRLEDKNTGGRQRHAFIGIGFRERTEAYDFQAALHDHIKYLNKKKTAEEMEQQFQSTSSVDYSLKEGETIVLQLKNTQRGSSTVKSKASELGIDKLSLADKGNQKDPMLSIMLPPPPPPGPLSPVGSTPKSSRPPPPSPLSPVDTTGDSPTSSPSKLQLEGTSEKKAPISSEEHTDEQHQGEGQSTEDVEDDDFGDFQAAG
ncbi:uncharacterized protein At1g03900-like isoform X2 [Hibiscus syriacus]|uniref:uncharacterized protein At1g03900-like isoform X2 n=1 Tax=Hibiscus syriacus TaxID=106335 RepID=UPI00192406FB|nr:uncharacterized protein At1g03900-like isoform X2 [Hibiscus syriacus]